MDIEGEFQIPASRQTVWEALNDPEVLKQCIPGCTELEKLSETELVAKVISKIGPVKATFSAKITLSDLNPPSGYSLSGEGKAAAAGFARANARVELEEAGAETRLRYTAELKVGGKLAQVGSRLIDGTARKLSEEFFATFVEVVGGAPVLEPERVESEPDARFAAIGWAWVGGALIGLAALVWWVSS